MLKINELFFFFFTYFLISHVIQLGQLFIGLSSAALSKQFKGTVHPKWKMLSSFSHPQAVPDLYEFISSTEHKIRHLEKFCCGPLRLKSYYLGSITVYFICILCKARQ